MKGHNFLKSLGRTKLRPAGGVGTNWLFSNVNWNEDIKLLEVACNQGDNLIQIYNDHKVEVTGVDLDLNVVEEARSNIDVLGLSDEIKVMQMDAKKLAFEDSSFDVVINEAMLTMCKDEDKDIILKEYFRILKKVGKLLTHDIVLSEDSDDLRRTLSKNINMAVYPHTKSKWIEIFENNGYKNIKIKTDEVKLLDKETIIKDEGAIAAARIFKNGLKDENKDKFNRMQDFFNNCKDKIGYILIYSEKE